MKIAVLLLQAVFLIAAAPLLSGIVRKIKNNFRMRHGAGIFQPYHNLVKFFNKEEVVSEHTSWIFRAAPYLVFAAMAASAMLVPVFSTGISLVCMGDFLLIIFLMAFARFFLTLAGLDAGSAFGGMGSSREMFISALAEPAMILAVFTSSLNAGATSSAAIGSISSLQLSVLISAVALFLAVIAETSRIPVDNQETHLELTMVHEAMILEYSGRSFALMEWASYIKQIIFYCILANILPPYVQAVPGDYVTAIVVTSVYLGKIAVIAAAIAVVEVTTAKMRLFRVTDFLGFAFALSVVSIVIYSLGW